MIELGLHAKSVALALGLAAAQGTILALLALVAFSLLGGAKLRPAWQAAVWLVVLAKFALPWSPALPWSLSDALAALGDRGDAPSGVLFPSASSATAHAGSFGASLCWIALVLAWAAGAATVIARAIRAQRVASRIAGAGTPTHPEMLAELAAKVGVRTPALVTGDAALGPFVVGLFRPTIVVPPALLADAALLRAALLHELAHVRRRDALGRLVQLAATALCFWWPVARLASRRLELSREAACDAWALESCEVSRPAYARLLVQMATLQPLHASAASMLAAPHALDSRVSAVLGPRRHARIGGAARAGLAAVALLALGGARTAAARGEKSYCVYTTQLAEALRQAHPEADLDGDGVLSRSEACELQASLRKNVLEATPNSSPADPALLASFRDEPLGCNYDQSALIPTDQTVCPEGPEGVAR